MRALHEKLKYCEIDPKEKKQAEIALAALFEETQSNIPQNIETLRRAQKNIEDFARATANKNEINVDSSSVLQVPWHLLATTTGVIGLLALGYLKTR